MNWVHPATFTILPIYWKHPDEYPRFRDFFPGKVQRTDSMEESMKDKFGIPRFVSDGSLCFTLYLRIGWSNRETYAEQIAHLRWLEWYVEDYDDSFDSTFAMFIFSVPKEWEKDINIIINSGETWMKEVSVEYRELLYKIYPKLSEKWDELFNS